MPYTRRQVKFLLSKGSPFSDERKAKLERELHRDPSIGHARKGSDRLKSRGRKSR